MVVAFLWILNYLFCCFDGNKIDIDMKSVCMNGLGLTQWSLSSIKFKFDDTRLSSIYENTIGPIFFWVLTLLH